MEAITLIADGLVPDSVYEHAAASLTSGEIAAVEWLEIVINAQNRVAIGSRYAVASNCAPTSHTPTVTPNA